MKLRGYRFPANVDVVRAEAPHKPVAMPAAAPVIAIEVASHRFSKWSRRTRIIAGATAGLLVVGAAVWWVKASNRRPARNWTLSLGAVGNAVVSPDGAAVVYMRGGGLVFRRLDSLTEVPLDRAVRITDEPAWSPDGSQLAVATAGALLRLSVSDGAASTICPIVGPTRGLSWSANGNVLFAAFNKGSGLYLVPAAGGTPSRLDVPGLKNGDYYQPQFLPSGSDILFAWVADGENEAGLYQARIHNGQIQEKPRLLRKNATAGRFSSVGGGMLLYVRDDALYAQKLDVSAAKLTGQPRRVAAAAFTNFAFRRAQFSVSDNGVLSWRAGRTALSRLTWLDRQGRMLDAAGPPTDICRALLSPDNQHVLITRFGNESAGIVEAHQTGYLDLPGIDEALWLPNSSDIIFHHTCCLDRVMRRRAEGGEEKEVTQLPAIAHLEDISPDGKVLLYGLENGKVYAAHLDVARQSLPPEPAIPLQKSVQARFSPDGKWIVYCSNGQVYIISFPAHGMPRQISPGGGREAVWRSDGKEILYRRGEKIFSVAIDERGGEIDTSPPEPLFDVRLPEGLVGRSELLAVTRDGSGILYAQSTDPKDPKITYVMTAWDRLVTP